MFPAICSLAGLIAGLFGLGGAVVKVGYMSKGEASMGSRTDLGRGLAGLACDNVGGGARVFDVTASAQVMLAALPTAAAIVFVCVQSTDAADARAGSAPVGEWLRVYGFWSAGVHKVVASVVAHQCLTALPLLCE